MYLCGLSQLKFITPIPLHIHLQFLYMPFSRTSKCITAKKLWPKYKQDFSWLFSSLGSHNSNVLNSLASDACDTKRSSHQLDSYQWENGFKERHERTEPIQLSNLAQNVSISNMGEAGSKWKDDWSTNNSSVEDDWDIGAKKLGIEISSSHSLREMFCSIFKESGNPTSPRNSIQKADHNLPLCCHISRQYLPAHIVLEAWEFTRKHPGQSPSENSGGGTSLK